MTWTLWLIPLVSAGVCWYAVQVVRQHAPRWRLMQPPNARSAHVVPTPQGGGVGLALATLLTTLWSAWLWPAHANTLLVFALLAGAMAVLGWRDDRVGVPVSLRLSAQSLLCAAGLIWLAPLPPVPGLDVPHALLWGVVWLVWVGWVNAYNFMDGIDGIAGLQGLFMSLASAVLLAISTPSTATPMLLMLALGLAGATMGFLVHNWPPARIFMGDVGSTFLGFVLGFFALWSVQITQPIRYTLENPWSGLTYWTWITLATLFIADTTLTLIRRLRRGEPLTVAHRSHAYQRLARRLGTHRPVLLLFFAINLGWVLPWAWATTRWPAYGAVFALMCYLPVLLSVHALGAGCADDAA